MLINTDHIMMIMMKHKIYELCIDTFFDKMNKNFSKSIYIPKIGEQYSKIFDKHNNEFFYNCTIISITDLSYYNEFSDDSSDLDRRIIDVGFAIKFELYVDGDTWDRESFIRDELGETHFTYYDLDSMEFSK